MFKIGDVVRFETPWQNDVLDFKKNRLVDGIVVDKTTELKKGVTSYRIAYNQYRKDGIFEAQTQTGCVIVIDHRAHPEFIRSLTYEEMLTHPYDAVRKLAHVKAG